MCGIYGSEESLGDVQHKLWEMRYRGPDASRVEFYRGSFKLGLCRLAIVDTEVPWASQPFITKKERVLAFNGEIYNYRDLCPGTPSEVCMLGNELLDKGWDPRVYLDGDYAIVYYDPSNALVTLYRDRWGCCPLYFQLRPFVAVSSERRRLTNPREVPAHGKVVIDLRKRRVRLWDVISRHYGVTNSSDVHAPTILTPLFLDAVDRRARHSDAGFSVALSGGLDSCAVLLAAAALGHKPRAITVALRPDTDDMLVAEQVAKSTRVRWTRACVEPEFVLAHSAEIFEHLDHPHKLPGPIKFRAAVRSWFVAKEAETKVILTGDGSDEIFEGYPPHTKRYAAAPLTLSHHQLQAVRSMPHINLDRTNKIGLRWSKEYRTPFLDSTFSYVALSLRKQVGKQMLREVARHLGAPEALLNRETKWGNDEKEIDALYPEFCARVKGDPRWSGVSV